MARAGEWAAERISADRQRSAEAAERFRRRGKALEAGRALGIAEGLDAAWNYIQAEERPSGSWEAHTGVDYSVVMACDQTTDSASIRVYGEGAEELAQRIADALNREASE